MWVGVDVGAKRKGFDVALIDDRRLLALRGGLTREGVIELVQGARPAVVAIDSPRSCARDGARARDGERRLNKAICGIRWTPDARHVHASSYYGWIVEGFGLFEALASRGIEAIEVFPTASWTRWLGKRASRTRSSWSSEGLRILGLEGAPIRCNQDQRDAIAAAVTARLHTNGRTEMFGEIVVPLSSTRDALGNFSSPRRDLDNAPVAAP
ncbi:MAG: DUF429 domain-containing protein [Solirubrobacterales bacterium]|nr:DUF429 domain-containing protein [Solirubrobacterales bacterium]